MSLLLIAAVCSAFQTGTYFLRFLPYTFQGISIVDERVEGRVRSHKKHCKDETKETPAGSDKYGRSLVKPA